MKKVATHYVSNNMLYFLRANIQQISKLCKCVSKYLATLPKIAKIIEAIEQLPVVPANYLRFIENSGGLYEQEYNWVTIYSGCIASSMAINSLCY